MKLLVTQPTFLPWIGYFDLIDQSDLIVFLDDVQFEKRSWQQRNRIKSASGLQWITISTEVKGKRHQLIKDVILENKKGEYSKICKKIKNNYNNSKYFKFYEKKIFEILKIGLNTKSLLKLNLSMINYFMEQLKIKKKIFMASKIKVPGNKSQKIINICKYFNCNEYLSTIGSKDYLSNDKKLFSQNNIDIYLHNYNHPKYNQLYNDFISYASILDLLFNEGIKSFEILKSGRSNFFKL